MNWPVEIFYGSCTAIAFCLTWRQRGWRAVAVSLVSAIWLATLLFYTMRGREVGDLMNCMVDGSLMLMLSTMADARSQNWHKILMTTLIVQLYMHVLHIQGSLSEGAYYLPLNVLYIIQLIALGWSGGRIVLVGLGDWLARIRHNRAGVYGWASRAGVGVWEAIGTCRVSGHRDTEPCNRAVGRGCDRCVNVGPGGELYLSEQKGGNLE